MRVALIHYSAAPIVGGVEQIVAAHAELFRGHGHEVKVICRAGGGDVLLGEACPYGDLKAALHSVEMAIVHNVLTMPFDMELTQALWRIAAEEPRKRWICWVHDLAAANPHYQHEWHVTPWDRLTKACPGFEYVAISKARARQFETLTRQAAEVIPNAVSPADMLGLTPPVAAFSRKHRLAERDLVLIHPTRLLQRKNVEFGMAVLAELRRRSRDAVLLITAAADPHNAVSAEYAKLLRKRRSELELESSALFVSDELQPAKGDISSLYALADALLFPSTQEGFGLPVLEAALHRLPIFCADVEPMNSLLAHSVHAFDPYGSPGDVAKLIERILEQSAPYRARREVLRRYTWDGVWERYLAPLLARKR